MSVMSLAKSWVKRAARPVGSVTAVRTAARRVVLTFDDGPEPGGTDKILATLSDRRVTATFFVLVGRVRSYPSLLEEVVAAGHEVGLHGVDHRKLTDLDLADVRRRMRDGRAAVEDAVGAPVRWFRPPYGRQTLGTWRAAKAAGLTPVFWGPSLYDWCEGDDQERVARALAAVTPGSIVLAHDGHAGPADGVDDGPAPAIDKGRLIGAFLDELMARGYTAAALGSELKTSAPVVQAQFRR